MLSLIVCAVAARHAAPHRGVETLTAALAALAEGREVRPVARVERFLHGIDGWHDDDERTCVGGALNFALVRVGDARARNGLRVRASAPHPRGLVPVAIVVLHLGPDVVVAGVGHCAIGERIRRAEHGAAGHFAALLQLQLHRIPELRALLARGILRSVFPRRRVDSAGVDGAGKRLVFRAAVFAGRSGEREFRFTRVRVVRVWVGAGRLLARGGRLSVERHHSKSCAKGHSKEHAFHVDPPSVYGALTLTGVPSRSVECP